jgi:putative transposase
VESFNSKLREECLRVSWFQNLLEARRIIANWRRDYNETTPHSSLRYMTPAAFAAQATGGKGQAPVVYPKIHLRKSRQS